MSPPQKYIKGVDLKPLVNAAFAKKDTEFDKQWALVDDRVKAYLDDGEVKVEQWACTAAARIGLQINGERTDNRVEQAMSVAIKIQARHEDPLTALVRYAELHDRTMKKGRELAQQLAAIPGVPLIPWAVRAYEKAKDKAKTRYTTDASCGASSVYVSYEGLEKHRRIVDFTAKGTVSCTCGVPLHTGVPCHHIIVALRDTSFPVVTALSPLARLQRLFDAQFFVTEYVSAYDIQPPKRPLLNSLVISTTVRAPPPAARRKAGPQDLKRKRAAEEGGVGSRKPRATKRHRGTADGEIEMGLLPKADPALDSVAELVGIRAEGRIKQEADVLKRVRAAFDGVSKLVEALHASSIEDKTAGVDILRDCTEAAGGFEAANRSSVAASAALQTSVAKLAAYSKDVRRRTALAASASVVAAGVVGDVESEVEHGPDDATEATEETVDTELDYCEFDKEDTDAELDDEYGNVQLFLNLHTGQASSSSLSASAGK